MRSRSASPSSTWTSASGRGRHWRSELRAAWVPRSSAVGPTLANYDVTDAIQRFTHSPGRDVAAQLAVALPPRRLELPSRGARAHPQRRDRQPRGHPVVPLGLPERGILRSVSAPWSWAPALAEAAWMRIPLVHPRMKEPPSRIPSGSLVSGLRARRCASCRSGCSSHRPRHGRHRRGTDPRRTQERS